MIEFMVLIRENLDLMRTMSIREMVHSLVANLELVNKVKESGHFVLANPLEETYLFVKGPNDYSEITYGRSKRIESITGFYVFRANDVKSLADVLLGCPCLLNGGSMEIREISE